MPSMVGDSQGIVLTSMQHSRRITSNSLCISCIEQTSPTFFWITLNSFLYSARSGDSAIEGRDTPKDEEEDEVLRLYLRQLYEHTNNTVCLAVCLQYYFSTVGKKIFARGLPFGWDKAAVSLNTYRPLAFKMYVSTKIPYVRAIKIREKFATAGKILSVATTKFVPQRRAGC